MKRIIFCISILLIPQWIFAADPDLACNKKEYSCYQKYVEEVCLTPYGEPQSPTNPWTSGPDLGVLNPVCSYEDSSTKDGIDRMTSCLEQDEQSSARALQDGVSLTSIGGFSGFRTLEVARLLYRKKMNSIFSCGIVANRLARLQALSDTIDQHDTSPSSEIKNKIKRERERYANMNAAVNCNQNTSDGSAVGTTDRMVRSATKEYCKYTYYLDYLEANLRENITTTVTADANAGNGTPQITPQTTDAMAKLLSDRGVAIKSERDKAKRVLPVTIRTFREMDRTYIIHVLLTIIYDDYITLRDQLDKYLVIVGQTFEKAFNAQDARQN